MSHLKKRGRNSYIILQPYTLSDGYIKRTEHDLEPGLRVRVNVGNRRRTYFEYTEHDSNRGKLPNLL
jgi:hypothetical protein